MEAKEMDNFMIDLREQGGLAKITTRPEVEAEVRLKISYIFMSAAQALIEDGRDHAAIGFLQSGRIVARASAGFLLLNHSQVEIDLIAANEIIRARVESYEGRSKTR